jgi:hypothetical protein
MMSVIRESLPDAVAAVFEETAGGAASATAGGSQIRTADEWATMLSAITAAGLLPQPELLEASRDLALPATFQSLQRRLMSAHETPRASTIDGLLDGAVNRVRHLHGLLAEWELETLSADQTARLVAMLEALRSRLGTSVAQLKSWHDGIHACLGPERCQSLFWDLIEAASSERASPHAFQREQLAAIEKRCSQLRVRSALVPSSSRGLASASSAAHRGIEVSIGSAPAPNPSVPPFKMRVVRCPHAGVSWEASATLLAAMDATKQLSLSRHAPAYLGHEPCVAADIAGCYPAHARWHVELVLGSPLSEALLEGGPLAESSLLFRHWRREIVEGLADISAQSTFLLTRGVTLAHTFASDDGCRIVFDQLSWGAEFPERRCWSSSPTALGQSLATPATLAAAAGHQPSPLQAPQAGQPSAVGRSAAQAALAQAPLPGGVQAVDHQALRDTLLLYDGVAMLTALLGGADAAQGSERSVHLAAILDACAHPTSPPTLRQLLSHPYFAPVEGFDKEDVRAAYRRWRRGGLQGIGLD